MMTYLASTLMMPGLFVLDLVSGVAALRVASSLPVREVLATTPPFPSNSGTPRRRAGPAAFRILFPRAARSLSAFCVPILAGASHARCGITSHGLFMKTVARRTAVVGLPVSPRSVASADVGPWCSYHFVGILLSLCSCMVRDQPGLLLSLITSRRLNSDISRAVPMRILPLNVGFRARMRRCGPSRHTFSFAMGTILVLRRMLGALISVAPISRRIPLPLQLSHGLAGRYLLLCSTPALSGCGLVIPVALSSSSFVKIPGGIRWLALSVTPKALLFRDRGSPRSTG